MSDIIKFKLSIGRGFRAALGIIASCIFFPHVLAVLLHKVRGVKIKKIRGVLIGGGVIIDSVYPELIEIEEGVFITRNATILSHFRPSPFLEERLGGVQKGKVVLKKGCFIGMSAIILPGVTIGEGAVVGAGSVVTHDVAPYTIVAGNPAKFIKKIL
jgi:acetyltransferase-like isoleucine patch superfamily enzyme